MSPTMNNFFEEMLEAAKAREALPKLEADLAEARSTINSHLTTIQRLETKLMDRANELTSAQSTIRSLEVERDDAQFHALEADDRTQRALDFIKATFGNAGALIQALEPPAPQVAQPVDTPSVAADAGLAGSGESAVGEPQTQTIYGSPSTTGLNDTLSSASSPAPEVAAQPDPTGVHTPNSNLDHSPTPAVPDTDASSAVSSSTEPGPFSMPPQAKPYEGKRWSQVREECRQTDTDIPWDQDVWLAGGGTIDNFYA